MKKSVAGFELFLLIVGSFAIAFLTSESVGMVNAQEPPSATLTSAGIGATKEGAWFVSDGTLKIAGADGVFKSAGAGTYSLSTGTKITTDATGKIISQTGGGGNVLGGLQGGITDLFAGKLGGTIFGPLLGGLAWGAIVGGIAFGVAKLLGLTNDQAASVGLSAGAGTFVGTTTYFYLGTGWGLFSTVLGIGVGAGILIATYKEQKKELIKFECLQWEPPLGGQRCEDCNADKNMPCSEYRCKSLGQACELVNKGTDKELCIWKGKDDTQAPKIFLWKEVLKPEGIGYFPEMTGPLPPQTGVKILKRPEGCLTPFTTFQFGFKTDEPAQCRADFALKNNFDEMQYLINQSNLFLIEHEQVLKVPDAFNQEGEAVPEIHTNGEYTIYVRCIDGNGNGKTSAAVSFSFCVEPGPDTFPPEITGFSIRDGQAVRANVDKVPIEVYTNEPAECKWSRTDKDFEVMENTMNCASKIYQINANLNYVCSGTLTAIQDRQLNDFYFRCEDYSKAPGGRNVMSQGKKLALKGTEELTILKVGPTGEILGGTTTIPVTLTAETAFGADNGKSTCMFSSSGTEDTFFEMAPFGTKNHLHNMTLDLEEGAHKYYFRCIDDGGNLAEATTNFTVNIDISEPKITRVYKDVDQLKIITNEPSVCVYSTSSCNYNFDQALQDTPFVSEDVNQKSIHSAPWDQQKTYYIKCQDLQGNRPGAGTCQIVVQGGEF